MFSVRTSIPCPPLLLIVYSFVLSVLGVVHYFSYQLVPFWRSIPLVFCLLTGTIATRSFPFALMDLYVLRYFISYYFISGLYSITIT
jgi:hypothetical protein